MKRIREIKSVLFIPEQNYFLENDTAILIIAQLHEHSL